MIRHADKHDKFYRHRNKDERIIKEPPFSLNIQFLSEKKGAFSQKHFPKRTNGDYLIPKIFSFIDNYQETCDFLKSLFHGLYFGSCEKMKLDYANCERIDVDASICMDIMLAEFITHIGLCRKKGLKKKPNSITPINFHKPHIKKILYSIGAFRNIKGITIKYDDVIALPVLINNQSNPDMWRVSEIHSTNIVEYIRKCLNKLGRELTGDAETEFYQVIGEVMSNSEEHSSMPQRFAIGYFQETHNQTDHFGVFNFSIFNFGKTIYEMFKDPNCLGEKAVNEMAELSQRYTKKGWLTKADFEEETLWTFYALQEGITSTGKKRGNGSIRYIENFFKLKGNSNRDGKSKLVLHSGNARIEFDGTYGIVNKVKPGRVKPYKMITFNNSDDIEDKPDKKFVTFVPHFFPGTLMSARILIDYDNTNNTQANGTQYNNN